MRFVSIQKARGLNPGQEVFFQDTDGKYGVARLVEESRTKNGIKIVFEVPQYSDAGATEPVLITNVALVSVPKPKKDQPAADGSITEGSEPPKTKKKKEVKE